MLEGPLTCAITLIRIEKVNRVFAGTIEPSTGEDEQSMLCHRVSSSYDSSLEYFQHCEHTFKRVFAGQDWT